MKKYILFISAMAAMGFMGCDNSGSSHSTNDGERKCSDDGLSVLVSNDGNWDVQETCADGCTNGKCNACTPGRKQCSGNAVQACSAQFTWETVENCTNGCEYGSCKAKAQTNQCQTVGESICDDTGNLKTCQADLTYKQTTCPNGCYNGYCKICTEADGAKCEGDNAKVCKDYLWEWTACPNGCLNGQCKDCRRPGDTQCEGDILKTCKDDFHWNEGETCAFGCVDNQCLECKTNKDCADKYSDTSYRCELNVCINTCPDGLINQEGTCTREIPFAGNTYMTEPIDKVYNYLTNVIHDTNGTLTKWNDPSTVLSFYFYVNSTGNMKVYVSAALPDGTTSNELSFTYQGTTHKITVDSNKSKIYEVGEWNVDHVGHVRIDIKSGSVAPSGSNFAKLDSFFIGGDTMKEAPVFSSVEAAKKSASDSNDFTVLMNRRGPYGCLVYNFPKEDDYEWFYNEVMVPNGEDARGTYFMAGGSDGAYMGIQRLEDDTRKVLFSVWSSYQTDNPSQIPKDYTVTVVRKGENVTTQNFGGEGSGIQSWFDWDWKTDKTYKVLVQTHPNGDGTTDFTGYFGDENGKWHLMATLHRPHYDAWTGGPYAFVETFAPATGFIPRGAYFSNTWARTKEGRWDEVVNADFVEGLGYSTGSRMDRYGKVDGKRFYVKICGFFDGGVDGNKRENMTRQSSGTQGPLTEADLDALP